MDTDVSFFVLKKTKEFSVGRPRSSAGSIAPLKQNGHWRVFFCIWKIIKKVYKQKILYFISENMKKSFIVIGIILLAIVIYFLFTKKESQTHVQIANPASVYCIDNGWVLSIKTQPDGSQYGMCDFDDGSSCEERSLIRKECKKWDSLIQVPQNLVYELSWISFSYPASRIMADNYLSDNITGITISISSQNIDDIQEPWFESQEALWEKLALESWIFGEDYSQSLAVSRKIRQIWSVYTKEYITLSQFEVCSVMFVKTIVFYKNNTRFVVSVSAPVSKVMKQMPEYFTTDENNCWPNKMRNFEKQEDFYTILKGNNWVWIAQNWFNEDVEININ